MTQVHGDETVTERQQHSRTSTAAGARPGAQPSLPAEAVGDGVRGPGEASTSGARPSSAASSARAAPTPGPRIGALALVRMILREEGVAGLYRGFGASVATYAPSSAVWWSAYGTYQVCGSPAPRGTMGPWHGALAQYAGGLLAGRGPRGVACGTGWGNAGAAACSFSRLQPLRCSGLASNGLTMGAVPHAASLPLRRVPPYHCD